MIRIAYCPQCRSTDQNCPTCGEPVRALRTAQLTYPACRWCGRTTEPYYSQLTASLRYNSPGLFYVACPLSVDGHLEWPDSRSMHTSENVPVADAIGLRRIAIKLNAERDEVL